MVIKDPLLDYGTPEEEAWRWKFIPPYIRFQRRRDTYLYTVKYYDKPEGQDLLGKLVATNRITIPFGFTWGVCDAMFHGGRMLDGFQHKFGRILHFTWPAAGVATAFTTATYFAAKLRNGKDDFWNYSLGALAAGGVVGAWQKCHVTGWSTSIFFIIGAYVQRIRIEEGWKWWQYPEQDLNGDHRWHKFGWDIYDDPLPKGYTSSTEKQSQAI